ncbi:MAG: TRAP transporter small permease subunit [Pseudomonadota bacterium]|nr:TRAP transporter small permease subunit [Pseudomonadota bacterium]
MTSAENAPDLSSGASAEAIPTRVPNRLFLALNRFDRAAVTILVLAGLVLYLTGIVLRNLAPHMSAEWTEELTLFAINWAILLTVGHLTVRGAHVTTTVVLDVFRGRWRRWLAACGLVMTLIYFGVLLVGSYSVIDLALLMDERGMSSLRLPMVWYYAALPLSMVYAIVRGLLIIPGLFRGEGFVA